MLSTESRPSSEQEDKTVNIHGRWGKMRIEYDNWEVGCYSCSMCEYRSVSEEKTHIHISEEHGTREKLMKLSDKLDISAESRIDRFSKVMETVDQADWLDELTTPKKDAPVTEVDDTYSYLTGPG